MPPGESLNYWHILWEREKKERENKDREKWEKREREEREREKKEREMYSGHEQDANEVAYTESSSQSCLRQLITRS